MRNVFLVVFLIAAFGVVLASRNLEGKPISSGNASVRSAAELYVKNCASCHGKDGRAKSLKGKLKNARDLADPQWQGRVSDERIFNSMPAYGKKLSEPEIDGIVTYVRGLKK
jgi:mono/diheme cytochrome c family protein